MGISYVKGKNDSYYDLHCTIQYYTFICFVGSIPELISYLWKQALDTFVQIDGSAVMDNLITDTCIVADWYWIL